MCNGLRYKHSWLLTKRKILEKLAKYIKQCYWIVGSIGDVDAFFVLDLYMPTPFRGKNSDGFPQGLTSPNRNLADTGGANCKGLVCVATVRSSSVMFDLLTVISSKSRSKFLVTRCSYLVILKRWVLTRFWSCWFCSGSRASFWLPCSDDSMLSVGCDQCDGEIKDSGNY